MVFIRKIKAREQAVFLFVLFCWVGKYRNEGKSSLAFLGVAPPLVVCGSDCREHKLLLKILFQ